MDTFKFESAFSAVNYEGVSVGDIVYAANTVRELRDMADVDLRENLAEVKTVLDDSCLKIFRVKKLFGNKAVDDYAFVYKLSTWENRKAFEYWWKYGSENNHNLEFCVDGDMDWKDVEDGEKPICFDCDSYHYRIKELYRPYENSKELVDDWLRKEGGCHSAISKPTIWLKSKDSEDSYMVQALTEQGVVMPAITLRVFEWKELFEHFTFLDGSEVGLLKEEK